jgi:hypothetical protein
MELRRMPPSADGAPDSKERRREPCFPKAEPNNPLQPTGLSVKHSARMKSRMLATEARGSALRWAQERAKASAVRHWMADPLPEMGGVEECRALQETRIGSNVP